MANNINSNFNKLNIQYCQYCGRECRNLNSLKQHECRCKHNPNKIQTTVEGFNNKGRNAWNTGLTKELDDRIAVQASRSSKTQKGKPGHPHTEEFKQRQRERALASGFGGFHCRRGIFYNGIKLDSSYEVIVAESLDRSEILWERPSRFPYHINGVLHYYTPDFYLPKYDIYLDPKNDFLIENPNPSLGYKDVEKIHQVEIENNIRVLILNKDQLCWEQIKNMLPQFSGKTVDL